MARSSKAQVGKDIDSVKELLEVPDLTDNVQEDLKRLQSKYYEKYVELDRKRPAQKKPAKPKLSKEVTSNG